MRQGVSSEKSRVVREPLQQAFVVLEQPLALSGPRDDDTFADREVFIAEHQVDVDRHARAESGAGGAGAERRVERERARFDLGERERVPVRARQLLGEGLPGVVAFAVDVVDLHHAAGEAQSGLDRVGDASEDVVGGDETVDDHRDVVLVALLQRGRLGQLDELAVYDRAGVSLRAEFTEEVDELALLLRHDRRDDLVAGALGSSMS